VTSSSIADALDCVWLLASLMSERTRAMPMTDSPLWIPAWTMLFSRDKRVCRRSSSARWRD
jgi:hypothetical protein